MATTVDQTWLDAQDPTGVGPYYLATLNETYNLDVDVITPGTAFVINNNGITFDLNNYSITYNDASPIVIPNGSFDVNGGDGTGWDLTTDAAFASIYAGTYVFNTVYDGDYSLKFSDPTATEFITNTSTITLLANTTYSLSGMFFYGDESATTRTNPGVKGYVKLIPTGAGSNREVSMNTTNNRGMQFREFIFTTGGADEEYNIEVGITGHASGVYPFYIDSVKVQQYRQYGVVVAAKSFDPSFYPGVTSYGNATNAIVRNGSIVQGQNSGTWCHGIFVNTTGGFQLLDLSINVNGPNSSCIRGKDLTSGALANPTVTGCLFNSEVETLTSRDNFDAAVVYGLKGTYSSNTIAAGPHAGFVPANSPAVSTVTSSLFTLQSRYTNGFAIVLTVAGSEASGNTITCGTGANASRGILVSGGSTSGSPILVYDNTITVQALANNQEYRGAPLGGAYAIQVENGKNVDVYENTCTANADEVEAYAFRMNSDAGTSEDVHVYDNTFNANSIDSPSACAKLTGFSTAHLNFEDNTFNSNDGVVGGCSDVTATLKRCTITITDPVVDQYVYSAEFSATPNHTTISLLDSVYGDAGTRTIVEAGIVREVERFGGDPDPKMTVALKWTTTVTAEDQNANPLEGVSIDVTNSGDTSVASGTTDSGGGFAFEATQLSVADDTTTTTSTLTATGSYAGQVVDEEFDPDSIQTVVMEFQVSTNAPTVTRSLARTVVLSVARPICPGTTFK